MAVCSFIHFLTDSELSSLMIFRGIVVVFKVRGGLGNGIVGINSSLLIGKSEDCGFVEGEGGWEGRGSIGSSVV